MTETEAAYLAGFFDADGSVGIYDRGGDRGNGHKIMSLRCYVGGIHEGSVRTFQQAFGGVVTSKRALGRRLYWEWNVRGAGAKTALGTMLPYLTVKRPQAAEALKYPVQNGHPTSEVSEYKRVLSDRLKQLKREVA